MIFIKMRKRNIKAVIVFAMIFSVTIGWVGNGLSVYALGYKTDNLYCTFTDINEKEISTENTNKRAKLIIFGTTTCGKSVGTVGHISESDWIRSKDVSVVFAESSGAEKKAVKKFVKDYQIKRVKCCYATDDSINEAMWDYCDAWELGYTISYPVVVYIDKNDNIRNVTTDYNDIDTILDNINEYTKLRYKKKH